MVSIVSWETCILTLACLRWSVKAVKWKIWRNVDTIFQNIIVFIATFCLTIIKSKSFSIIFGYYSFMGNLYLTVACLRWSVKAVKWKILKNVDTIFQNIIVYTGTFCLTIVKIESFPIIYDFYSFMGNLYFDCSMLEVVCESRRMKNLEKHR